jgi:hypothetical protein
VFVAVAPPGVEFFNKGLFVRDAAIETLGRKDTQFGFRDIKPIAVLRRVMPFERPPSTRSAPSEGGIAAAQPHNIFFYDNYLRSQDRLRRSSRDESESSNHFKLVEANH